LFEILAIVYRGHSTQAIEEESCFSLNWIFESGELAPFLFELLCDSHFFSLLFGANIAIKLKNKKKSKNNFFLDGGMQDVIFAKA